MGDLRSTMCLTVENRSEVAGVNADRTRQLLTVLATVFALGINGAANALPLNGQLTGEISDRFQVFVTPAGYVFAIWFPIYVGLVTFTVEQALASRASDPLLRRLGWLPALSGVLNGAWIVAWHWEAFPISLVIMVGLLLTLIGIHLRLRAGEEAGELTGRLRWSVRLPFSIYVGWITVATIANAAAVLPWAGFTGFGLPGEVWAVAVLLIGLAIATAFVLREDDPAYGLVIVWAYLGILIKEWDVLPVAVTAGLGAGWIALLVVRALLARTGGGGSRFALTSARRPTLQG
jgi:hypothetical protein